MFSPVEWWYDQLLLEGRAVGQLLHGSATTTEAVRRGIQAGQECVRALAWRYRISPATVQKWRKRSSLSDALMSPKRAGSTVLSLEQEVFIVAFRHHTLMLCSPRSLI
jgi:hypothetical protein